MRGMSASYIPPCCSAPSHAWLLPTRLDGACMVSSQFDPALWHEEQFALAGIAPARGVAKRQSEFLAGRICAREALVQLRGEPGVPAVGEDGAPQWPGGVVGSITHGQGRALAVVAPAQRIQGLGLDIETLLPPARAERLQGEILSADELRRLDGLDEIERAQAITLTFSIKESLFKALYPLVGRRFYFHDAELLEHDASGNARLRLLIDLSTDWRSGALLDGQFACFDERLLSLVAIPAAR